MIQVYESEFDSIRRVISAAQTLVERTRQAVKPEEVDDKCIKIDRDLFDNLQRAIYEYQEGR